MKSWSIPGIGGSVSWTTGASKVRVHGVSFVGQTSVDAGNRRFGIVIADSTGLQRLRIHSAADQAANNEFNYCFFEGIDSFGSTFNVQGAWPQELVLEEGDVLTVEEFNGVSEGDTVAQVVLQITNVD